jgi:hypothetical protein
MRIDAIRTQDLHFEHAPRRRVGPFSRPLWAAVKQGFVDLAHIV